MQLLIHGVLNSAVGYRDEELYVPALFYADNGPVAGKIACRGRGYDWSGSAGGRKMWVKYK